MTITDGFAFAWSLATFATSALSARHSLDSVDTDNRNRNRRILLIIFPIEAHANESSQILMHLLCPVLVELLHTACFR
jgi:hypothetical protein